MRKGFVIIKSAFRENSFIINFLGNKIGEEFYKNDTLDGLFLQWYDDGLPKVEGQYIDGLFDGKWVYYDVYGKVVGVGNFTNGTGVQKGWWPNGNIKREIPYLNNQKHGIEKWYDEDGKLEKEIRHLSG